MLNLAWVIFWLLFAFFFVITLAVGLYILNRFKWNYAYVVLEEQPNGNMMITRRGRARLMSFGDGGEEIFYLKGMKKWRVAYGKRIGKNQIAWGVGKDGYWYNIDFGSLDKKLKEVGVFPVDRDMRYAYAAVRKGIDSRFENKTFLDKYGTVISFGMLFLCICAIGAFAWLNNSQQKEIAGTYAEATKTTVVLMEKMDIVVTKLNNINVGGSGVTTAPTV